GATLLDREAIDRLDELHLRIRESSLGRKRGPADDRSGLQLEAADQLLRHERVGGTPFAKAIQVEQLAVAALLRVDIEHTFDPDDILRFLWCGGFRGCRGLRWFVHGSDVWGRNLPPPKSARRLTLRSWTGIKREPVDCTGPDVTPTPTATQT